MVVKPMRPFATRYERANARRYLVPVLPNAMDVLKTLYCLQYMGQTHRLGTSVSIRLEAPERSRAAENTSEVPPFRDECQRAANPFDRRGVRVSLNVIVYTYFV